MGKQWTPPASDEVVNAKSQTWTPPSDDEVVAPVKNKSPFSSPQATQQFLDNQDKQPPTAPGFTKFDPSAVKMARTITPTFNKTPVEAPHKNSWTNLGTFVPQKVIGGLDKDAGQAIRFLGSKFAFSSNNPATRLGAKLEGWGKEHERQADEYALPNTTGGNITSAAVGFGPDLVELALTPELDVTKLGKLGEVLTKYGGKYAPKVANAAVGKFPLQQGAKGLAAGYSNAKDKGMSDADATAEALKNAAKEYGKGLLFEGAGKAAEKATDLGKKVLEDNGLMAKNELVAGAEKKLLHSTAQAAAFSAVPFVSNALQGKTTSLDELKNNAVFGGILGLLHSRETPKDEPTPADGSAKEALDRSPLIDLNSFMSADMDAIKGVHEGEATPHDLQLKAASHAEKAFQSDDPESKQDEVVQASVNGKLSGVKAVTQAILKDKDGVIDAVNELPLSDEAKSKVVDKINAVHRELDHTEQQKTALGNQIQEIDDRLKQEPKTPVEAAENEVLKGKRDELNKQLISIIKNQDNEKINEKSTEKTGSQTSEGRDEIAESDTGSPEKRLQGSGERVTEGGDEPPIVEPTKNQNNAVKEESIEESGQPEHQDRDQSGQTETPGNRDSPISETKGNGAAAEQKEEEDLTGIRNEDVAKERGKNVPREKRTIKEIDTEGKRLIHSGELHPDNFAKEIIESKGKRAVTAEEEAALLYHKKRLEQQQERTLSQITPENVSEKQAEFARLSDELERNRQATELAGNVAGRSLRFRQEQMRQDFSLTRVLSLGKMANGGEELSAADKAEFTKASARIKELENNLAEREEKIRQLQDKQIVSEVKRRGDFEDRKAKRINTKASLRKEREDIWAELHTIARKSMSSAGANKIPVEMLPALGKLARNYVMDGAVSISQVADKIYNDLKDHVKGITTEDIHSAISDHFDDYLKEKNAERLEKAKARATKKLEQLKEGSYEQRVYNKIQADKDYLAIRADIRREQGKILAKLAKIENGKKSIGRKVVGFAVKYGRQAKLSSASVLGKLGATGLVTAGLEAPQELVGKGLTKLLPSIAKKSDVGGSVSRAAMRKGAALTDAVGSLAEAYTKAATQGMRDAADQLSKKKGYESDLTYLYKDGKAKLPGEAIEFFGRLHSAIKAPIKRFTFERSYSKRVAKAIENGLDPTDSIIDAQNKLDAYKDAEKSIFMGDNWVSKQWENAVRSAEGNKSPALKNVGAIARILVPFVKVPTNIALETSKYVGGGLSGATMLAKAFVKGTENLTPEQADIIMEHLKKGSVGAAALAMGYMNPKAFGGYYQPGEKRSPYDAPEAGIKGIPKWLTEHPIFQAMQVGATFRRLMDKHKHEDDGVTEAMIGTTAGVLKTIPQAEQLSQLFGVMDDPHKFKRYAADAIKGEIEPAFIQQLARMEDNDIKRAPAKKGSFSKYLLQDLEEGLPVIRKNVPRKH